MGVSNSKMPPRSEPETVRPREGSPIGMDPPVGETFPVALRLNLMVYTLLLLSWLLGLSR